ncbi:unnamed protein product [Rotaria sp. Silwood1]|nr:unnamed protein product [Rotaria sp. Silwood1]CAF5028041.1 unnamed protein product [Rotaria sp. Silwood1]
MTYSAGLDPRSITVCDFNKDEQLDIIFVNHYARNVGVLLGHGNGSFDKQKTYPVKGFPTSVVVGDFNDDSRQDIAVASNDNQVSVLLYYDTGDFEKTVAFAAGIGSYLKYVVARDFNNDSNLDLVVANSGTDNIGILLGFENSSFGNQNAFRIGSLSRPSLIAIGDFNNDT